MENSDNASDGADADAASRGPRSNRQRPFTVELSLADDHWDLLTKGSRIAPELVRARPYVTVESPLDLIALGFPSGQWRGRGFALRIHPPGERPSDREIWVYRPDVTVERRKYLWPAGVPTRLDAPLVCHPQLADPSVELWIVEGWKKGDALASCGLCVVALAGVDNWRGTNAKGGKTILPDWHHVALNRHRDIVLAFDSDVRRNPHVARARRRLTDYLTKEGDRS